MELVLTGRMMSAEEALKAGLINKVVPIEFYLEEAKRMANEIANRPPVAVRLAKEAILKFYKPILRLWIYPSFESYIVWIFNEPDFRMIQPKNLIIRQIIWDRNADAQRLNNPLEGLKKGLSYRTEN